ncbi:hypothetical protein H696_01087 [Fonticula alba]|uniref:Uncharacterized protein n=1 Tax=Fonticula alba TaxID=691883 RepID=A0A058ZCK3_FONAL|nr:hypothetical protein H696_01087 [Fonticula alba]KCV71671.1 hypothetical protein H696_01087 [Fonticula alba]|eukprot:XP_009493249.1 hypothetical protein H696_01087 [Fonticula alba]
MHTVVSSAPQSQPPPAAQPPPSGPSGAATPGSPHPAPEGGWQARLHEAINMTRTFIRGFGLFSRQMMDASRIGMLTKQEDRTREQNLTVNKAKRNGIAFIPFLLVSALPGSFAILPIYIARLPHLLPPMFIQKDTLVQSSQRTLTSQIYSRKVLLETFSQMLADSDEGCQRAAAALERLRANVAWSPNERRYALHRWARASVAIEKAGQVLDASPLALNNLHILARVLDCR